MAEHVQNLLSAYIDNELNNREQQEVENHLPHCLECQRYVEELTELKEQLYVAYESVEIPNGFEASVIENIQQREFVRQKRSKIGKWIGIVIAALLIFAVFIQIAPLVYLGMAIVSTLVTIGFSMLQAISLIMSSVPYLLGVILVVSIIVIAISVWSLHLLLEKRIIS